jgi:hypothetical protein
MVDKTVKKFNFTKWSFILGVPITLIGTFATLLTVPDVGCKVGLALAACIIPSRDIDLITQTETGEPLAGVRMQFIAKGAPEVQFTDSNGYARVQLPSKGDVRVSLSKEGYPVHDFTLNVQNTQDTVRVIRLNPSGKPDIQQVSSTFDVIASPVPSPVAFLASPVPSLSASPILKQVKDADFLFSIEGCYRKKKDVTCELTIKNQGDDRRIFSLNANPYSNVESSIFANKDRYVANAVSLGNKASKSMVSLAMPSNIDVGATLSFSNIADAVAIIEVLEVTVGNDAQGFNIVKLENIPIVIRE